MRDGTPAPGRLSRRELICRWGGMACAVPAAWLVGACSGPEAARATSALPATAATTTPAPAGNWATGGTARIGAAVRAANPFAGAVASTTACQLTCEATIGPCHTLSPERTDISDGWDGLPMHMRLRVVDEACQPVAGAIVEVWHTNHTGGYSGDIRRMCNNDAADLDKRFFRGWQRTDADGTVRFDSCYPGWYSSRAVHVHLRVMKGDYDPSDAAASWLTSQLLFTDELNAGIFGGEPLYQAHGQPDTSLATDTVMGGEQDVSPYLFDVQNIDGVMLASKTLVIRNSLDRQACRVREGRRPEGPGGPGGPGGMPPRPPSR